MERQDEIIPEHPNSSNIRCSPLDKRCIQKNLARNLPKSTNQRTVIAREEAKAVLVRHDFLGCYLEIITINLEIVQTQSVNSKFCGSIIRVTIFKRNTLYVELTLLVGSGSHSHNLAAVSGVPLPLC